MFARKNLPSLDDVPCCSLAKDIESSASLDPSMLAALSTFAFIIEPSPILVCVTAPLAINAEVIWSLPIFAVVISPSFILAAVTELACKLSVATLLLPNSLAPTALAAICVAVIAVSYTHLTLPTKA